MSKVIVITGGSGGLGKALTEDLTKDNKVIILATNQEELKKVAEQNNCDYFVCDVTNYYEVEEVIDDIIDKYGVIDVLINNAGLMAEEELDRNDPDEIKNVIEVNLLGVINVTKAVIPIMKENKNGLIINSNSKYGISSKIERTVYCASKWGVTGFTKSLQLELAKYEIKVTDIYLGALSKGMNMNGIKKDRLIDGIDAKEVVRLVKFIIDTPKDVMIPEVVIKHINDLIREMNITLFNESNNI